MLIPGDRFYTQRTIFELRILASRVISGMWWAKLVAAISSSAGSEAKSRERNCRHTAAVTGRAHGRSTCRYRTQQDMGVKIEHPIQCPS